MSSKDTNAEAQKKREDAATKRREKKAEKDAADKDKKDNEKQAAHDKEVTRAAQAAEKYNFNEHWSGGRKR